MVDASANNVPPGRVGERLVRPERPHLTLIGCVRDPDATARAWRGGWFRTGDQVRLDEGWLYVEGRSADVVRRRVVNISPHPVEEVIARCPASPRSPSSACRRSSPRTRCWPPSYPAPAGTVDPAEVRRHRVRRLPRHALPRGVRRRRSLCGDHLRGNRTASSTSRPWATRRRAAGRLRTWCA
jgi:crotonobetaine/carnitine-CoA ligase